MSAAKNDAWMAFYTADYLKDTTRLTTLGHGAYILLLIEYWNTGPLPDNDEDLAAITRMPLKDWLKMRPNLARLPFFNVADGIWRQKRADEEIAKREGVSSARSTSGKGGAIGKWGSTGHAATRAQRLAAARQKGTHTKEEWVNLVEIMGHKCVRCGISADDLEGGVLCKDHILPIYQGGSDSIENIQPLCRNCNSSKGPESKDWRNDVCQNWRERLAKCLANARQTPAQSQSQEEVKNIDAGKEARCRIIRALDDAIAEHHGEHRRRPNPNPTDWDFAGQMLETGASVDLICATIEHRVGVWAADGQQPPASVSTFVKWVEGAVRDQNRARQKPGAKIADSEVPMVDQDAARLEARIAAYRSTGVWQTAWGDKPADIQPIARVA